VLGDVGKHVSAWATGETSANKVREVRSARSVNNNKGAGGPERGARSSAGKSLEGRNFKKDCGTKQGHEVRGC
jgi:hypothetical protein